MLPDYKQNLTYTPLRFRHVHDITITAAIASGVATLITAESSPNVTISGTNGTYTVTIPKGQVVVYANGSCEKTTGAAANTDGNVVSFGPLVATSGTFTVYTQNANVGALTAPADGKLRLRIELGKI